MSAGRFAPSPTGRLHLGNLRTGLLAWLAARSTDRQFLLRFEDLDKVSVRDEHYETQLADLSALGIDWDGEPVRQTERLDRYEDALDQLLTDDRLYPCYCSRREIREAVQAPNGPQTGGLYPGTCRSLTASERAAREAERPAALRLRAEGAEQSYVDRVLGPISRVIDDIVVRRNDGTPAYNLVVVLDDDAQGIDQVVRADDLVDATPSQVYIAGLLGIASPEYLHVPLVLGHTGIRLAKRDGAVTLGDRQELGESNEDVLSILAASCGLAEPGERVTASDLIPRFAARPTPSFADIPTTLPEITRP